MTQALVAPEDLAEVMSHQTETTLQEVAETREDLDQGVLVTTLDNSIRGAAILTACWSISAIVLLNQDLMTR